MSAHAPAPVPSLPEGRPRRVLVTGASGFIGRSLVPHLVASGWIVRAASRTPVREAGNTPAIERVAQPDLGSSEAGTAWRALVDRVDAVVHLAGIAHASRAIPTATYMRINGEAVETLAAAARAAGVKRVVLMSSVRAQVGPVSTRVVVEDDPAQPTDDYGRSKLRGEIGLAGLLAEGPCDHVILRPVLVYGPGVKGNMRQLVRLARMPLPLPLGRLDARRSLLSLPTLCDACRHVLDAPAASRATLLLADKGPALSVREMLLTMRAALGRAPALVPLAPDLLRAPASLAGRREVIDRLLGPLAVDCTRLARTGFTAPLATAAGLYLWMQQEAGLTATMPA